MHVLSFILSLTAARSQTVSENEPEALEVKMIGWKDVVSQGGMLAGLVAGGVALFILIFSFKKEPLKLCGRLPL